MEKDLNILNISFPKDAFMQDDFNVDRFLQESCSKSELNKLHNELGSYIKYLQSIMIDIVNSESNAIVNLSSDLKVLQNKFSSLLTPLGQFREKILLINKTIDVHLNNMKYLIDKKDMIASIKSSKRNELRILLLSHKINHILLTHLENNSVELEVLERSVDQYILLQMYSQQCSSDEFKLQMTQSPDVLMQILNNEFLKFLLSKDTDNTVRCLQMYVIMNTQCATEQLYRQKVVQPAMHKIINEECLAACKGNLCLLYAKIIDFIKTDMKLLLSAVSKLQGMSKFNFILNSVWLEVHDQIIVNLSSIFASGNPGIFHLRYKQTCDFLKEISDWCLNTNENDSFFQHPTVMAHKNHWNLHVYYEIRYLEIVQNLEKFLPKNISPKTYRTNPDGFRLEPCQKVWESMVRCFDENVYLPQLLDRFWKLNLQIISRLNTWTRSILNSKIPLVDVSTDIANRSALVNIKINFLVNLHKDLTVFIEKFNNVFNGGLQYLRIVPHRIQVAFEKCLAEPQDYLRQDLEMIESMIIDLIYSECSVYVKQISQIPRLFRKTNRNVPTTPSGYVSFMTKPAENFYDLYKNLLEQNVMRNILTATHRKIIKEYKTLVENLLTSVTKTEESLRRLKKIRTTSDLQDPTIAMSDDQKIRLQVQIDVSNYNEEAKKYLVAKEVKELVSLLNSGQSELQ